METTVSLASTGILTQRDYDEQQLVKNGKDDSLDRNAFLTLLTTQLQNQNPLDPMKNEEFVAQLAQFSQLEGITNMSTSLSDVADVIRSDRIMTGANLVGKSVFAATGRIDTDGQTPSAIEVDLPYGAEQVDVGIYDATSGALLRSIVAGPQSAGVLEMTWDGRRADGTVVPPGSYIIRGTKTVGGNSTEIQPSTYATVKTVSWDSQAADLSLNLSGGAVLPLANVTRIGQASAPVTTAQAESASTQTAQSEE